MQLDPATRLRLQEDLRSERAHDRQLWREHLSSLSRQHELMRQLGCGLGNAHIDSLSPDVWLNCLAPRLNFLTLLMLRNCSKKYHKMLEKPFDEALLKYAKKSSNGDKPGSYSLVLNEERRVCGTINAVKNPTTKPVIAILTTVAVPLPLARKKLASEYSGCNRCHKEGHFVRDCPLPCHLCLKCGHTERLCPTLALNK
jgi:hypothetical protein